jgi:hypothetical protein
MRMKLTNIFKYSALAAAVIANNAFAGSLPTLPTIGKSGAGFAGGATINGGASYLETLPAGETIQVSGQITVASSDVGKTGDILIVAKVGNKFFQADQSGWTSLAVDLNSTSLGIVPYSTGTLPAHFSYSENDLAEGLGIDLTGKTVKVLFGYAPSGAGIRYGKAIKAQVAELPSSNSTVCPDGETASAAVIIGGNRICTLSGTYTEDLHLTNNFDYVISGAVRIGMDNTSDAKLIIDPGVTTYGQSGNDFIWIDRGAQIWANGTKDKPITMTSANDGDATATTRGEWGGLVINGNAPINGCSEGTALCEAAGEGNSGMFGGNDADDNSGSLTYLRVKYAGFLINDLDELNGIAFQGVGSGTNVDYVQVHNNQDDGVEFFGGTVNAKHLYLTGNRDDSLDWTKGWSGSVQHVVIVQGTDTGDQGFEMDNNGDAPDYSPRALPYISNVTMIGNDNTDIGMLIREGTGGHFHNMVVKGFADGCIDIDQTETFTVAGTPDNLTGDLVMTNTVVDCKKSFIEDMDGPWLVEEWFDAQDGNVELDTGMTNYVNSTEVNALESLDPTSISSFFDEADYVGAVPSTSEDWTAGWTFRPL